MSGDDTCDACGYTGAAVGFTVGGGALCYPGHGCQKAALDHPVTLQPGSRMCVCGAPEFRHTRFYGTSEIGSVTREAETSGALFVKDGVAQDVFLSQPRELMRLARNDDGDLVITINHEASLEEFVQLFLASRGW